MELVTVVMGQVYLVVLRLVPVVVTAQLAPNLSSRHRRSSILARDSGGKIHTKKGV